MNSSTQRIGAVSDTRPVDRLALLNLVAGRVNPELPPASEEVRWEAVSLGLARLARRHGVSLMVQDSPAFLKVPDHVRAAVTATARYQKMVSLRQLGITSQVLKALDNAGIPVLLLKGYALSVQAYGDWMVRGSAADLDLLVSSAEVGNTEETLRSLGFMPEPDQPDRVFSQTGNVLSRYAQWLHYERTWNSPEMGTIDLHWRALPGGAKWNLGENLIANATVVELPIGTVKTLPLVESLIVACSQGTSENWIRLKRLADLAALQQRCSVQDIAAAEDKSKLVAPSLSSLTQRWIELPSQPHFESALSRRAGNLWRMRRGSGSSLDAAVRSALGVALPSRRFGKGG